MSIFGVLLTGAIIVVGVALLLGYFLPRFSAYFLGPVFLVLGGGSFVTLHKYFFTFQSDGSMAGLIVPAIMWLWLTTCCLLGVVLIATGLKKAKRQTSAVVGPDA